MLCKEGTDDSKIRALATVGKGPGSAAQTVRVKSLFERKVARKEETKHHYKTEMEEAFYEKYSKEVMKDILKPATPKQVQL